MRPLPAGLQSCASALKPVGTGTQPETADTAKGISAAATGPRLLAGGHHSFKKLGCKRLRTYTPPATLCTSRASRTLGSLLLVCSNSLLVQGSIAVKGGSMRFV